MSASSSSTIFACVNSMIGGAMITMPILFMKSGIFLGVAVLLVSGFISYKTCRIFVIHLAQADKDVDNSILRISGPKWERAFKIITGIYLVLLNIIYVELIADQLYDIIYYILTQLDHQNWIAKKGIKSLVFDSFSIQYETLVIFVPLLSIIFIKNLSFLVRLTSIGVISVFIYVIFLIYQFAVYISSRDLSLLVFWTSDLGNLAGTCAVAFTIHTVVASIMKNNMDQSKNQRDLKISYVCGFIIYVFIGIVGTFAILGNQMCKTTIVDCFIDDWRAVIVQVSYLLGLITVFPCFLEVGRTRLLMCFFPEIKPATFRIFNVTFMMLASIFTFFSPFLPLDLVMNLVGSILCFFFVYLIPSKLHIDCLYPSNKNIQQSLISENEQSIQSIQSKIKQKCSHDQNQGEKYSKNIRLALYGLINVVGVAVGVYGIYQFIASIIL